MTGQAAPSSFHQFGAALRKPPRLSIEEAAFAENVRRAVYWSLLGAPTAGVTYGGHGVWGWDDGTKPPTDHPYTGTPMAWQNALTMPAAEQMAHVPDFFATIDWWRLRPAPLSWSTIPAPKARPSTLPEQSQTKKT